MTLPVDELRRLQPIVLDAAYIPRETPLLRDATAAGCTTIEGIEMLFEQGCAQSELWTHRTAARREIAISLAGFLSSKQFGQLPPRLVRAAQ